MHHSHYNPLSSNATYFMYFVFLKNICVDFDFTPFLVPTFVVICHLLFPLLSTFAIYCIFMHRQAPSIVLFFPLYTIDNIHFEHMVHRIYPAELQLNKADASDTKAAFLDLNLSIHKDIVSTKIYENGMILILILLIYRSLMAMSLNVPLMVYKYLNLFALPEHLRMLLSSIIVTNS